MMDAAEAKGQQTQRTWKPITAGVLDIILGGQCLIVGLGLFLIGVDCSCGGGYGASQVLVFCSAIALPLFIVGALAIRGGLYALKRKRWGFALAGAIVALSSLCSLRLAIIVVFTACWISPVDVFFLFGLLLGIAAIVLTALSKNEFE